MRSQIRLLGACVAILLLASGSAAFAQARPPLSDAAKRVDHEGVRRLIKEDANVNALEGDGSTALLWAAAQNSSEAMVRRLLQAGADPNLALIAGETPLMVAARTGAAPVVAQLLAKGAKVNVSATRGQTALMWAVS